MSTFADMNVPTAFIFLFVIVPGIALLASIFALIKRSQAEKTLFKTGLVYLKKLRTFLMYVQQHRGLTNGFFHGNLSLAPEIEQLEHRIDEAIIDIQSVGSWVRENGKWESLIDHWQRIRAYFKTANAEISLKQHNNLIANLLYLIDDLAFAHHLGELGVVDSSDANWRKLLFIAEYVGQARALGMGAATRGNCTSVARIQLNHLTLKIEANINPHWSTTARADFSNFLSVIKQQILSEPITVSGDDYFKLATICIDHLLSEFDRQVDKIQIQPSSTV